MYCIKCGVELSKGETKCPLCGTVVYHPDMPKEERHPPYPPTKQIHMHINRRGVLLILTAIYVMLMLQLLICDMAIFDSLTWSLYATGGLLLSYIFFILPLWFRRPNPVIFIPSDFAAVGLYLLFIDLQTQGGWFLSFAFPVIGIFGAIVTAVITLVHYVRRGYFYIFGGAIIAFGGAIVLLEFFLNLTFSISRFYFWSIYPLIGCFIIGMALIVIGICKPLQESLAKKFFL